MKSKNPYYVDGKEKILDSFCIYLDILGYKKLYENFLKSNQENEMLEYITDICKSAKKHLINMNESKKNIFKSYKYQFRMFSDNFIIGCPVDNAMTSAQFFFQIFKTISIFQISFISKGIPVRGAITMGGLHVGDDFVLGQTILEAYKIESEISIYPRILISQQCLDRIDDIFKDEIYKGCLLKDADSNLFVNYLYVLNRLKPKVKFIRDVLFMHKTQIESNLYIYSADSKVWSKYIWMASYHNYYCKTFYNGDTNYRKFLIDERFTERKFHKVY